MELPPGIAVLILAVPVVTVVAVIWYLWPRRAEDPAAESHAPTPSEPTRAKRTSLTPIVQPETVSPEGTPARTEDRTPAVSRRTLSSRIGNLVLLLVAGAIYYGACVAPKQRQSLLGNKPFKSALPPSFHPPGEFFTISIDGEPQRERLDETRDGIRFRGTKYRWQKDEFLVVVLTLRGEGIGALDADQARLILAGR